MFLPPDLREWVPPEDMVHFVIEAVAEVFLEVLQLARTMGVLRMRTSWNRRGPMFRQRWEK